MSVKNFDMSYQYVLDRGMYEHTRAVTNMVFMLDKHMNDKDASYVGSPVFDKLLHKAEVSVLSHQDTEMGVLCNVFGKDDLPCSYNFIDDCTISFSGRESCDKCV